MDSQERHDLEKNELAHWLVRLGQTIRAYIPHILIGLVLVAAAAVTFIFLNVAAKDKAALAWSAFAEAQTPAQLEQLMIDFSDTPIMPYAQMRLGWVKFTEGKQRALDDRADSLQLLDEAISRFESVLNSPEPLSDLKPQAALGIAMAKEVQSRTEEATALYENILRDYENQPVAMVAKFKLDTLKKPESAEFYAMLKNYQPPEPSLDLPPVDAAPPIPEGLEGLGPIVLPPSDSIPAPPEEPEPTTEPESTPPSEQPQSPPAERPQAPPSTEPENIEPTAPETPKAEEPPPPAEPEKPSEPAPSTP